MEKRKLKSKVATRRVKRKTGSEKLAEKKYRMKNRAKIKQRNKKYYRKNKSQIKRRAKLRTDRQRRGDNRTTRLDTKTASEKRLSIRVKK